MKLDERILSVSFTLSLSISTAENFVCITPKKMMVAMYAGIVAVATLLIWSKILTSHVPDERLTVSDIGDILSPKMAPQIIAPAVIAGGIFNPPPIPISATPNVAAVPQDVPVHSVVLAQTKVAAIRNIDGEIIFRP